MTLTRRLRYTTALREDASDLYVLKNSLVQGAYCTRQTGIKEPTASGLPHQNIFLYPHGNLCNSLPIVRLVKTKMSMQHKKFVLMCAISVLFSSIKAHYSFEAVALTA